MNRGQLFDDTFFYKIYKFKTNWVDLLKYATLAKYNFEVVTFLILISYLQQLW